MDGEPSGDIHSTKSKHFPLVLAPVQKLLATQRHHSTVLQLWHDAGPGERVPGEPPSHGRDLANVSGHAISAVLYSNQYTVLFDTEPTEIEVLD